jgi:hypothetical protein
VRVEWRCGCARRRRRSVAPVRAICGCGLAGGTRPQIEARNGGDGFSGIRAASLGRHAEERCVVRARLIFEVRAVRQSFDCGLQRLAPLGATLDTRSQWPKPVTALQPACPEYGGSTCSLPPLAAKRCLSAPSLSQRLFSLVCQPTRCGDVSLLLCACR